MYLNPGLTIIFNGEKYFSENGLHDLLTNNVDTALLHYPIVHLRGEDIEIAMTHATQQYGETYYSFVNGQHTSQGGTHQAAAREAVVKTIREFYGKPYPLDFYPELAQSDMTKALNNALTTKQVNTQEVMLIDFEKNTHWFNSTIVPVCNDKGAVEYFLIVSLDTTSKKQAELALAESNKNLEKTVLQRTEELSIEIAERKKIEKKMTYLATHDSLTDLPNRHLLIDRLEQAFLSLLSNNKFELFPSEFTKGNKEIAINGLINENTRFNCIETHFFIWAQYEPYQSQCFIAL